MCDSGKVRYCVVLLLVLAAVGIAADSLEVKIDGKTAAVRSGGEAVVNYRYGDVPFKPYVKELFTPGGVNVLLDAPHDHLHHHALMLALGIDGVDFWGETPGCGSQKHVVIKEVKGASADAARGAGFVEALEWADPKTGKLLAGEKRLIAVRRVDEGKATLLTWRSVFTVGEGLEKVTFEGRHYFGLGMRFVRSMDVGGRFFNADGVEGEAYRGDERMLRSRWCAYTAEVEGKKVTVAMFDAPKNVRHPAVWFTMNKPFAYISATLGLYKEPLELEQGKRLNLRYGVVLWDGEVGAERIEAIYREWAK